MALEMLILSIFELIGVICALLAVVMGVTKGRQAIMLTGGGLVEVTVTYLLMASVFYLAGFGMRFVGALADSMILQAVGAVLFFGMGFCFFMIFKKVIEHLEQLRQFSM